VLYAACLTVLIEGGFFLLRRRRGRFLLVCALANLLTNLSLNMILQTAAVLGAGRALLIALLYGMELAAVLTEYALFSRLEGRSRALFWETFFANCLSYCMGLLLFGHI